MANTQGRPQRERNRGPERQEEEKRGGRQEKK
jgi:hypothetical protein